MVDLQIEDSVAFLKLNRPEKRNALSPALVEKIISNFNTLELDDRIKFIILTGEGSSFCAGADIEYLEELRDKDLSQNLEDSGNIARMLTTVFNSSKITIAAVNGPAIAGGCGLACVCDFVIADKEKARFGFTEVKIGFLPAIVSVFINLRSGYAISKQLLLSGELIDANKALQVNLANSLSNNVLEESFKLAERLSNNSYYSMKTSKQMLNSIVKMQIDDAIKYCTNLNVISRTSPDFKDGINSFLTKK